MSLLNRIERIRTCQRFMPPLETIQSFSLVAAYNTDILKSDNLHEESDVDEFDKQELFCNTFRSNN